MAQHEDRPSKVSGPRLFLRAVTAGTMRGDGYSGDEQPRLRQSE